MRRWLSRHAMGAGTDSMVIAETIAAVGVPALKPADGRGISFEKVAQFNEDHDQRPDRDD